MRDNGPVTQDEFVLSPDAPLVSTTDLQSHITYCNPAFVTASGFQRDELIGHPHNLIRHPDMPAEAFRDMWDTLKAGEPWTALVKNRRKDGGFYWVRANVTPVRDATGVCGYMSVRTKPGAEEVRAAEKLYAQMREEHRAAGGGKNPRLPTRLHRGELLRPGWAGVQARLARHADVLLEGGALLAGAAVAGALALGGVGAMSLSPVLAVAGAAVVTTVPLLAWLRSRRDRPLLEAALAAERLASGDLTQQLTSQRRGSEGRLMRALSQLNVNLQAVVGDVRQEVDGVHLACAEIASGGRDLGERTEQQAGSLEQAAAALEQVAANVKQTADGASNARGLAGNTSTAARNTGRTSAEAGQSMDAVREATTRINEIVGVIDGISFQTNILALNAAVEAARAGDAGRGFAVVATEVRMLAGRTRDAAREIKQLAEEARNRVEEGVRIVADTARSAHEAETAVDEMNDLIGRISDAVQQQSGGIAEVNGSVADIDGFTQQNSALVEELSASAMSLAQRAELVTQAVRVFRLSSAR
ncbi:methyl-accepting chemotaxis protein [Roseateles cellulosilyticus]|uniref:Methyl-accepting chemotaxis protein n=1 Tax=Pelomonas cellulosilytica TaxID=2906762 RepID=A0ABS8Y162_9BURK|nr:PAS domain-containing methyl-accepting chemotaxis protein [Pelomonas sp. P8]MCE4555480.1 methyl-accepting chemotaxis protein [Pelomonas sp. P8]